MRLKLKIVFSDTGCKVMKIFFKQRTFVYEKLHFAFHFGTWRKVLCINIREHNLLLLILAAVNSEDFYIRQSLHIGNINYQLSIAQSTLPFVIPDAMRFFGVNAARSIVSTTITGTVGNIDVSEFTGSYNQTVLHYCCIYCGLNICLFHLFNYLRS